MNFLLNEVFSDWRYPEIKMLIASREIEVAPITQSLNLEHALGFCRDGTKEVSRLFSTMVQYYHNDNSKTNWFRLQRKTNFSVRHS